MVIYFGKLTFLIDVFQNVTICIYTENIQERYFDEYLFLPSFSEINASRNTLWKQCFNVS
jgi:hypothetical protein